MKTLTPWQSFKLRLLYLFPRSLPRGAKEFDSYCDTLFALYQLPNLQSYKEAIATMILHLSPTTDRKSPLFFVKSVKKAMANQVAYSFLHPPKEDEEAKKKASEEAADPTQKTESQSVVH